MMLGDLRNQVMALACLRHGLSHAHGRQAHELPREMFEGLSAARATDLGPNEQARSLRATVELYRTEAFHHDAELAASLGNALDALLTV